MTIVTNRAIFLDRDGVINQSIVRDGKPFPPSSLEEVIIPIQTMMALKDLRKAGFRLIGITNQPDVARGNQRFEVVEAINQYLMEQLPIDEIYVCYHDDTDHCECRKPKPGLILKAAQDFQIDLTGSYMIGDRWKDVEAGRRAGCKTIFIDYGYVESELTSQPDIVVGSLKAAADQIISMIKQSKLGSKLTT